MNTVWLVIVGSLWLITAVCVTILIARVIRRADVELKKARARRG